MRGLRVGATGVAAAAALLGLAACGGDRQDANGPSGTFKVEVVSASFPARQNVSQPARLRIRVRNAGDKAVPSVSVTVATQAGKAGGASTAFGDNLADPAAASKARPIWIVDESPGGGDTSVTNTWSLGRLAPGRTRDFTWSVVPVKGGDYRVAYSVSPDLTGKAKAARGRTSGSFDVAISDVPPDAVVGDDGQVVTSPGEN